MAFPESLVTGLNYLDTPAVTGESSPLAAAVSIGHSLVKIGRHGRREEGTGPELAQWALDLVRIDPLTAEHWVQTAENQFVAKQNLIAS